MSPEDTFNPRRHIYLVLSEYQGFEKVPGPIIDEFLIEANGKNSLLRDGAEPTEGIFTNHILEGTSVVYLVRRGPKPAFSDELYAPGTRVDFATDGEGFLPPGYGLSRQQSSIHGRPLGVVREIVLSVQMRTDAWADAKKEYLAQWAAYQKALEAANAENETKRQQIDDVADRMIGLVAQWRKAQHNALIVPEEPSLEEMIRKKQS